MVIASGNVELVQNGRIVKADKIAYNLGTDKVRATGNVVLTEVDGTTYFADDVELTQDMKNGFVEGLQILLADGSRFAASEGTRTEGTKIILKQASYTPCEPCKEDPSRPPVWQLRAKEVTHDKTDKMISYRNAWFEFAGVPLLYTPYFAHPDGTEKQKSGFLPPSAGLDSELGANYQQKYYWAVAPDKDVTVGALVATDVNPVGMAEYRQRFENAEIMVGGSATYSDRTDSVAGQSRYVDDEARGHFYGEGLWNMDEKWRSGFKAEVASDDQYMRQYNFSSDDVLENEIYVERFDDRDYFVTRAMGFQDIRVSDRRMDQPMILPETYASFYGSPNGMLGGRWDAEISALGLMRDGNGQDMTRGSLDLGWERRFITGFGLVNKLDLNARGDIYNIQDRDDLLPQSEHDNNVTRGFAQANWETSYPFAKRFESAQMVVAPVVSFTAGTNIDYDADEIPNEDSQDITLDALNLFEPNRFPGYDRIEDRNRVTYGMRTGLYGDNGYRGEVFLGQSRRLEASDNPFQEGSGLSDKKSDYVGQISAYLGENFDLDYRFQLENDNFSSQRHELDSHLHWDRLNLGLSYFYANALEGTDLDQKREQIQPSMRFRFYEDWYALGAVTYDFGEFEGLRHAYYGIEYEGQCLTFSGIVQRSLTDERTGDSSSELLFRIGLKNLGEFQTSGIGLDGGDDSSSEDDDYTYSNDL
ncbi:MAG: LPS-assembly protein LptD [Micavibrio aeruginosavorus]|uniref:LPS-assembly protein LptD n=1 Tax=Micavibrio aeruginosavorus TaxID=349221 RepID=A0A2W4ZJL9_9BACT|nr:MAG: LPS-assembly protein LptD [Micavibrio aeruginosavorus]